MSAAAVVMGRLVQTCVGRRTKLDSGDPEQHPGEKCANQLEEAAIGQSR